MSYSTFFLNRLYLTLLYTTTRIVVVSPLRARQFLIEESDGKTIYLEDWWSLTSSDNNEWPKKRPLKKALSERDVQLAAAMGLHDKWIEDPCGFSFFFPLAGWTVSHWLKKGRRIMRFWKWSSSTVLVYFLVLICIWMMYWSLDLDLFRQLKHIIPPQSKNFVCTSFAHITSSHPKKEDFPFHDRSWHLLKSTIIICNEGCTMHTYLDFSIHAMYCI